MITLGYGNDNWNHQQNQMEGLLSKFLLMQGLQNLQAKYNMLKSGIENPDDPVGANKILKKWEYNPNLSNGVNVAARRAFGMNTPNTLWQDYNEMQKQKQGFLFGTNNPFNLRW